MVVVVVITLIMTIDLHLVTTVLFPVQVFIIRLIVVATSHCVLAVCNRVSVRVA